MTALGLANVRTYIQSGNILFRTGDASVHELTSLIEEELSTRFSYAARAVVLPYDQFTAMLQSAPADWGKSDQYRHNALFTLRDTTSSQIIAQLPTPKKDIESIAAGPGVVFWSVSQQHVTKSTFMRLPMAPIYQQVTVRNHNTVFKLLELFNEV
jgi:uncharacterized protein (DUF1697 family)